MSPVLVARGGSWAGRNTPPVPYADASFEFGVTRPTPANTWLHYGKDLATVLAAPITGSGGLLTITQPGQYTGGDYACYVTIDATGVTAANPIVFTGNRVRGANLGTGTPRFLVRVINCAEVGAVVVSRNWLIPDFEFDQLEAIRAGGKVIVERNWIQHTIDGITMLFGRNRVRGNLLTEGRALPTTTQPDGITHTDGIVAGGGDSDVVQGNDVSGWRNAAIFAKAAAVATYGAITNLLVDRNWLTGGGAVLHVFKAAADAAITCTITGNRFPDPADTLQVYVASTVTATISGNVKGDGSPATVTRFNAG